MKFTDWSCEEVHRLFFKDCISSPSLEYVFHLFCFVGLQKRTVRCFITFGLLFIFLPNRKVFTEIS
ncbi:hypothetical protein CW304_27990 [Bacillus sp. UFRGS-B20]|nr:hypothetical protein CW304_27990 [Bacillus sp. UFRGS-B20]